MILFNWIFGLAFVASLVLSVILLLGVLQGDAEILPLIVVVIVTIILKKLVNVTDGVNKEKVHEKINELNSGILNSNDVPSHFTASQCNDMAFLAMEVSGYENELRESPSKKRVKEIYKSVINVEKKAKAV